MIFNKEEKQHMIIEENQKPEEKFLHFFNSIEMKGWKTWHDFEFFWKLKKISTFFFFMAVFSGILNLAILLYPQEWKNFELYMENLTLMQFMHQMKVDTKLFSVFSFICINLLSSLYFALLWFLKIDEVIEKFRFHDVAKSYIAYKITTHRLYLEYVLKDLGEDKKMSFIKQNPQYDLSCFNSFNENLYQTKTVDFIFDLYTFLKKKVF